MNHHLTQIRQMLRRGAILLAAALLAASARADISEPATIFYGQIINRTSGQPDYVNQGTLVWTISSPSGQQLTLSNSLQSLDGGRYCYQLSVPHEALGYGLSVSSNSLPMPPVPVVYTHVAVTVNGMPAGIMAPGSSDFNVSQSLRAATYRLDLELTNALASTSGDGIPDWWKALYGVTDTNADPDHDGWSNLQEFLHGGNPNQDNRIPTLATTEQWVYADGTTGIQLQAIDSDSGPTNLFYTLTTPPTGGTLLLRNSTPNGTVNLNVYRPSYPAGLTQTAEGIAAAPASYVSINGMSGDEEQMLVNYFLSRDRGYVIWDASRASMAQQLSVPSSGLTTNQYSQYVASYGHD